MSLDSIVNVQISTVSQAVTRAGFGVPLILSANAAFVERTRTYDSLTAVGLDFLTTTPEYKMAAVLFSQNPRPERVVIGRATSKPTQRWKVTVPVVANDTVYAIRVGANTATFTSDASATNDEIVAGLNTQVNLLAGDTLTATVDTSGGAGFHFLRLTGNAPGSWDAVELVDVHKNGLLAIEQDHADPGAAASLDAIALDTPDFYAVVNPYNSKAMALAIAGWVEANERLFLCDSQDTAIATTSPGSDTTTLAYALKNAGYVRTHGYYHPAGDAFTAVGEGGRCLPLQPGSETWKFKTLAGVPALTLTPTMKTNLDGKNFNYYYTVAGRNITSEGVTSSGEYVDVVRGRDWHVARMQEDVFAFLASVDKVPMTDGGITRVDGVVKAVLQEGVDAGLFTSDPAPETDFPLAKDISSADRAARTLRGSYSAQLAGAVHKVILNGTILI